MQDDATAKRSLSVWLFSNSFVEIAMISFKKVQEIEQIIDDEDFVLSLRSIPAE